MEGFGDSLAGGTSAIEELLRFITTPTRIAAAIFSINFYSPPDLDLIAVLSAL
jgi:hypothetical protein